MSMTQAGQLAISNILSGMIPAQMEDPVMLYEPQYAVVLALTTRLGQTRTVPNMEYKFESDDIAPVVVALAENYTAGGTMSVAIGDGMYFAPHAVFKPAASGVQYWVESIAYASGGYDKLTIRKYDASSDVNIDIKTESDDLVLLGQTRGELAAMEGSFYEDPTIFTNYCQNFSKAVDLSDISMLTQEYGKNPRVTMHAKRQLEIKQEIEMCYYLGEPFKDTTYDTTHGAKWMMGGLKYHISTNDINFASAVITEQDVIAEIPELLKWGSVTEKAWLCSSAWLALIASWGHQKLQINPSDKRWGFQPVEWVTPYGAIPLVHDLALDNWKSGKETFLVTANKLKKVLFTDGALKMLPNLQARSDDQRILDGYRSRHGFQPGGEKYHACFRDWGN